MLAQSTLADDSTTTPSTAETTSESETEKTETTDAPTTESIETTEPMETTEETTLFTEIPTSAPQRRRRRRRRRQSVQPLPKNASTIIVTYTPNDFDQLQLHYDSNDPLNYYNYATQSPPAAAQSNGRYSHVPDTFLPAQHRQQPHEQPVQDNDDNNVVEEPFHINSFETVQVPYKMYNTILRYSYIDGIKSSILELPLNSDNYNLLIVIPDVDNNLDAVLSAMRNDFSVNLRQLRRRLRPNWIKTIVPKFHQKGNIVLTTDLMKV